MSEVQHTLYANQRIAVIIPCYKESRTIAAVIKEIPEFVRFIIVVDDGCPEDTGQVATALRDTRVQVVRHEKNQGVGAAMKTGYRRALELGCDLIAKVDGDGQMDMNQLGNLLAPLASDAADYAKGNRFNDFTELKQMPKARLLGNSILSFWIKIASGYWNIFDPTNGFTAINKEALTRIDLAKVADSFFFEIDMLIRLNIVRCVVKDVPVPSKYPSGGQSSLHIGKILVEFPTKIFFGMLKRILYRYFIYDFNMASVYILLGLPVFLAGIIWGSYEWFDSIRTGIPRTAGTIMLVALPIILGFQMLLQAVSIDVSAVPTKIDKQ